MKLTFNREINLGKKTFRERKRQNIYSKKISLNVSGKEGSLQTSNWFGEDKIDLPPTEEVGTFLPKKFSNRLKARDRRSIQVRIYI